MVNGVFAITLADVDVYAEMSSCHSCTQKSCSCEQVHLKKENDHEAIFQLFLFVAFLTKLPFVVRQYEGSNTDSSGGHYEDLGPQFFWKIRHKPPSQDSRTPSLAPINTHAQISNNDCGCGLSKGNRAAEIEDILCHASWNGLE